MSKQEVSDSKGDPDEYRINGEIEAQEVRLVDHEGENRGKVTLKEALALAEEVDLDLVEVSPMAEPPVCKIIGYSKFRYMRQKRRQEQRRRQKTVDTKEIKLRPNIDLNDYNIKVRNIGRFLEEGHRVKVSLRFRGRELAHQELGMGLLEKVREHFEERTRLEHAPSMEGKQLVMILVPR